MKRYLLIILSVLVATTAYSQSVPRYVLIEHFTNTRCTLCPSRNDKMVETLEDYEGEYHLISYHPPVPYNDDIFYLQNPTQNEARRQFYGVGGTPIAFLWGNISNQGTTLIPTGTMNASIGQTGSLEVRVRTAYLPQQNLSVQVEVETIEPFAVAGAGDLELYVAIVENTVDYNAPNGETEHFQLFRQMLTDINGDVFSLLTAEEGSIAEKGYSYVLDPTWDVNELEVIAFVVLNGQGGAEYLNSGSDRDFRVKADLIDLPNATEKDLSIEIAQGVPPYTIIWKNGANIEIDIASGDTAYTRPGLQEGTYFLEVTDSLGRTIERKAEFQTTNTNIDDKLAANLNWTAVGDRIWQLRWTNPNYRPESIKVLDLNGRLVQEVQPSPTATFLDIDLKGTPQGIYILQAETPSGIWTQKAVGTR
ncbi:MAG: Omp28-related outer membrane protein [Bacteroidota bacterium]